MGRYVPNAANNHVIGKFGVTDIGDSHFSLHGTFASFENNTLVNTDVAHGNAEIVSGKIVISFVNTFFVTSEEYGYSMINFQLNASTLGGTARSIDTVQQFSLNRITQGFSENFVEFAPNCQQ